MTKFDQRLYIFASPFLFLIVFGGDWLKHGKPVLTVDSIIAALISGIFMSYGLLPKRFFEWVLRIIFACYIIVIVCLILTLFQK
jgi:hypothetical protein